MYENWAGMVTCVVESDSLCHASALCHANAVPTERERSEGAQSGVYSEYPTSVGSVWRQQRRKTLPHTRYFRQFSHYAVS